MPVQVGQCGREPDANPDALLNGNPATALQIEFEGASGVGLRSAECGLRNGGWSPAAEFRTLQSALRIRIIRHLSFFRVSPFAFRIFPRIIRQFHDVVKTASLIVASDV